MRKVEVERGIYGTSEGKVKGSRRGMWKRGNEEYRELRKGK